MRIRFAELDFVAPESGVARVFLSKTEPLTENVTVPLMAYTYEEFYGMGMTLPSEFDSVSIPDAAECESNNHYTCMCISMHHRFQVKILASYS